LFEYDGSLFCGHDSGTFIVKMALQKYISKSGTWKFKTVPNQKALLEITPGFQYWKKLTISGVIETKFQV
jgi:hypothetical protein